MYITRLEMSGFKSFANKTALEFRPGVMAVVGPNGCGKTNIVDAVRWVLGEQRAGSLRAERMEAVIFNGTTRRKPLGFAEVTLTIENNRGVLPTPYSEVAITRRLFRSGESEYLINREPSRLRDIADMFTDTGFGHNAYSIIELPMIEGIITGPSDSRRALLEEAAGVAHYKSRRTAAERRLDTTRESLVRLNDVYSEVEKSYSTLKRQASRAKRQMSLQRAYSLRLLVELARERLGIMERREPMTGRLKAIEDELTGAEAESARLTAELLGLEAKELTLNERVSRAMDAQKRIERREAELAGELALVKQREKHLTDELAQSDGRKKELEAVLKRAREGVATAAGEIARLEEELKGLEGERSAVAERSKAAGEKVAGLRAELDKVRAKLAGLEQTAASSAEGARRNRETRERLEQELKAVMEARVATGERLKKVREEMELLQEAVDKGKQALEAAKKRLESARAEYEAATVAESAAAKELSAANEQREAVRGAVAAHSARVAQTGIAKGLREVVTKRGLLPLAARIECDAKNRTAIASALGSALEGIDLEGLAEALELADKVGGGEKAIFRLTGAKSGAGRAVLKFDGGIAMADLVFNKGDAGEFIRGRLADAFLVPDLEAVNRLAGEASAKGVRLVTPEGTVLYPDGLMTVGLVDPDALQMGWTKQMKELEKELKGVEEVYAKRLARAGEAKERLAKGEKGFGEARQGLVTAEDEAVRQQRRLDATKSEAEQLGKRFEGIKGDAERINVILRQMPKEAGGDDKEEERQAGALMAVRAEVARIETALKEAEAESGAAGERRAVVGAEVARISERLLAARREKVQFEGQVVATQKAIAESAAKVAGSEAELKRTRSAAEGLEYSAGVLAKEREENLAVLETARNERADVRALRERVTGESAKMQDLAKRLTAERNSLELELVGSRERLRELDRRLVEDAGVQPQTITEETPTNAEAELQTLELADLSAEQLKVRMQTLGPVNMLALDELREVEERYRFLSDQKKDLESGVELLVETIERINSEARRRMRETFERVDANFGAIFRTLFEGGEAKLTLDGDDLLEADIRIWATPTGKKLQGLGMLSGGEKALTAIALLFAIYKVRPSPFCILDEVDAPLDDANVVRFNALVRGFTTETQFLIVTHNKRTMEAADCLFGVTLADDGTSQLVSVKLESNGQKRTEGANVVAS